MPSKKRRRGGASGPHTSAPAGRALSPAPSWKWWTFPVYLALTFGLFVGYNAGVLIQPHTRVESIANVVVAVPFSLGLAQLVTRPLTALMLRRRAQKAREPGSQQR